MLHCIQYVDNCYFLFQLYGYTPLHLACLYDQTRVVAELLKKFKTEQNAVNAKDKVSMNTVSMNQIHVCEIFIILLCSWGGQLFIMLQEMVSLKSANYLSPMMLSLILKAM